MPVTCPGKSGIWFNQLNAIDDSLRGLRLSGILPGIPGYDALYKMRGELMGKLGLKAPKPVQLIMKLARLSPGEITLWMDGESGWMTEARVKPGAPPVYKAATAEVAMAIIKGELTHEQEAELMKPDEYIGE